jgi:hypothetical protein
MVPVLTVDELRDLIAWIQVDDKDGAAWRRLRVHLKPHVQACIVEVLGPPGATEQPFPLDLARDVERQFWKQLFKTRPGLPRDPSDLAAEVGRMARGVAERAANDYRWFGRKLAECEPDVRPVLAGWLPAAPVSLVEELASETVKHLWYIRHKLGGPCASWNAEAAAFAAETAEIASLLLSAGDSQTLERLFTILRKLVCETVERSFPDIQPHNREDVVQDAVTRVWRAGPRVLHPARAGTLKGLVRLVAIRAAVDWTRRNRRYLTETELEPDE